MLLLAGASAPALAQESQPPPPQADAEEDAEEAIVIIGLRELLEEIPPERTFDPDTIAGYGLGTVEDLLAEIAAELGEDEEPVLLVNGRLVDDPDEVAFYPVEAVRRVDVLPRGASARVGAPAGRRVISVVLRRRFRSLTVTAAPRFATEGDWSAIRGEAILTRIRGPNRLNLSLQVRDEGALLESERGIIQPAQPLPHDLRGNVIADPRGPGAEIDPALSAAAGALVTVAGIPPGANPALADFAARANAPNETARGAFRTLRGSSRQYDLGLAAAQRLTPWLNGSLNARFAWSENESLSGLARGLFVLPAANPFSPFSSDVGIAAFGDPRGLDQQFRSIRGNLNLALFATFGRWRGSLSASHQRGEFRTLTERQDFGAGPILLQPARNPFAGSLADLLPTGTDRSVSRTDSTSLQAMATGSPLALPAGPAQATLEARLAWSGLDARSTFLGTVTSRESSRSERAVRAALDLPLASRRNNFLPALGELSANFEAGFVDVSRIGTLSHHGYGLSWMPVEWVRLFAAVNRSRRAADLQMLFDPLIVTPQVRTFDFLTGETVDATWITGGNPALRSENLRTRRLGVQLRPMPSIGLLVSADYLGTRNRDFVSSLPPASLPILLAFPDRFVRDSNGRLVMVDVRAVNFARYEEDRLRYGFSFSLPVGQASAPRARAASVDAGGGEGEEADAPASTARGPQGLRPRLQVTANHTVILDNDIVIRPGLAPVDLLEGGAIGIAGGRPRHQIDFAAGLSGRGLGARLTGIWRGGNALETRFGGMPDRLRFAPYATLNLRAFGEASRLLPDQRWLRGTRFSLNVTNLLNERQRVTDSRGTTPLQYQPGYRDSLGRVVEFEIRRVF